MSNEKYKKDGVNVAAGDKFSSYAADLCRETYNNSKFVDVHDLSRGNFRGPRGWRFKNIPDGCIETGGMDGIGTRVVIIDAAGNFTDAASNLVAMTGMDITRWGGLPLLLLNIFDVRSLGEYGSERFKLCKDIMWGLWQISTVNNFVMFSGETAELGPCVGSENSDAKVMFNWGACMIGVYHPEHMILGDTLRPGQMIMALADDFRSNGASSTRKALAIKYGSEWWKNPKAKKDILDAATPSVIYDRFLNYLHGWFNEPEDALKPIIKMHSIVHLSGGAFESKLGKDILKPLGLSAELTDLFEPPPIMKKCAEWRGLSPEECYSTWNGGQGAIVVIDEDDKDDFVKIAKNYGIKAKPVGKIIESKDYTVAIKPKFGGGKMIYY